MSSENWEENQKWEQMNVCPQCAICNCPGHETFLADEAKGQRMKVPYRVLDSLREVTKPSDYPGGRCYVIQFFSTSQIYHEGDERSRTNPGHGYPAYTETVLTVRTFVTEDEQEWLQAITLLYQEEKARTDVAIFKMEAWQVETQVSVHVSTE